MTTHHVFGELKEAVKAQPETEADIFDPSERSWIDELPVSQIIYAMVGVPVVAAIAGAVGILTYHWFGPALGIK